jgi:VCBS repeat-containing protein
MQQTSQYAKALPAILAEMGKGREEDEKTSQNAETEEPEVIHVYPLEGGGLVFTKTPIEEDDPGTIIVDSQEPETESRPTQRKDPPYFLYFFLILLLLLLLDSADTALLALLTPTATITIMPKAEAITTTATFHIGAGRSGVQGRVLPALTVTQSLTVPATGRGHQDAKAATGIVTLYNGLSTVQSVAIGTILTGQNGISVVTNEAAIIPPANPPSLGETSVTAHALQTGSSGNIQARDINIMLSTGLFAKNTAPFSGGQNERDFSYVTQGDIQQAMSVLTPHLLQSEQAALSAQLQPGETLAAPTCTTPGALSNRQSGDEATEVKVTVSETCMAAVYNPQSLQKAGIEQLFTKVSKQQYSLAGTIQITVRSVTIQSGSATLTALLHGVWVYQINEPQIQNLVAGKKRLDAIQLLSAMPGVEHASIAGITDNQFLPEDAAHIHLLILLNVS